MGQLRITNIFAFRTGSIMKVDLLLVLNVIGLLGGRHVVGWCWVKMR